MSPAPAVSPDHPQQRIRVDRFLLAFSIYGLAIPLLAWSHHVGLLETFAFAVAIAAIAVVNGSTWILFKTGINRRFRDPSLTWPQMLCGMVVLLFVMYNLKQERSTALVVAPVLLLFGVFRFSTREFIAAALVMLAGYAGVIALLATSNRGEVDLALEWYRWLVLACALPGFALIGGKSSELRNSLRRTNDSLRSALGTIQRMATHDGLTGLANRTLLNETLVHILTGAYRHQWQVSLLFIDLDRFKVINDSLGHAAGDRVLRVVAQRLAACAERGHMVARLGGDEFVLVIDEVVSPDEVDLVAREISRALAQPIVMDGRELHVGASIGISTFPTDAADAQTLLLHADLAMYRAKDSGGNTACHFADRPSAADAGRIALEAELRRAIDRREFVLQYQPKVCMATGRVIGVEALVRWRHPELGMLPPDRFIEVAEHTGLIVPLGHWVLEQACKSAKRWARAGVVLPVAVNLSARQMQQDVVAATAAVLHETALAPHLLELEITESATLRDPEQACAIMRSLRDMGIRITLDDFGTGYSSLGYLKRFPVDGLKIDRSFVGDLPHSVNDVAIARAIIAMARTLNVSVTAEGVEREDQLACLRAEGCSHYQGFLCAPALDGAQLLDFVRAWNDRTAGATARSSARAGQQAAMPQFALQS